MNNRVARRRPLARALARALARMRRRAHRFEAAAPPALTPSAFRAVVDERLRSLERQLDEVKGRVNGLLFLLAGSVAAQIVLGLAT